MNQMQQNCFCRISSSGCVHLTTLFLESRLHPHGFLFPPLISRSLLGVLCMTKQITQQIKSENKREIYSSTAHSRIIRLTVSFLSYHVHDKSQSQNWYFLRYLTVVWMLQRIESFPQILCHKYLVSQSQIGRYLDKPLNHVALKIHLLRVFTSRVNSISHIQKNFFSSFPFKVFNLSSAHNRFLRIRIRSKTAIYA